MTVIDVEGAAFPDYNEATPVEAPRNRRRPDNLGTITLASVQGRGIDGYGQLEALPPRDSQPGPVTDSVCLDGCRAGRPDRRMRVRVPPARRAFCLAADDRSGCSHFERAFWRGSPTRRRRGSGSSGSVRHRDVELVGRHDDGRVRYVNDVVVLRPLVCCCTRRLSDGQTGCRCRTRRRLERRNVKPITGRPS
jgi:hypothetical protein